MLDEVHLAHTSHAERSHHRESGEHLAFDQRHARIVPSRLQLEASTATPTDAVLAVAGRCAI
jgi:hypothetical protein